MLSEIMLSLITSNLFFSLFPRILVMLKARAKENQLLVLVHLLGQEAGAITSILER